MRKKDLLKKIEELNAKVFQLEQYAGTQDALISAFKKREAKIVEVLQTAEEHAEILEADTQKRCARMLTDAESTAGKILKDAEESSERIVTEAKKKVEVYRRTVKEYNNTLLNAAKDAREKADSFALYARNQVLEPEELDAETDYFANKPSRETVSDEVANPAVLMHNIYKLQNRELPEDIVYPANDEMREENVPRNLKRFVVGTSAEEPIEKKPVAPESVGEPEEAELKKVSELLDKEDLERNSQEPNLDALLDEIINFGETKDGERKE